MDTLTVPSFRLALLVAFLQMPALDIYRVNAWNLGIVRGEPWRTRTSSLVRRAADGIRSWLSALWSPRVAFACLAVLLAILLAQHGAGHGGLLLAVAPVAVPAPATLVARRAALFADAEALRGAGGTFADDAARAAFDAKMTEVEALDAQIRAAEAQPAPVPSDVATRAAADERARITGIHSAVQTAQRSSNVFATPADQEAFTRGLIDAGHSLDKARSDIFARLAAQSDANPINPRFALGEDAKDKWLRGAGNWLITRSGFAALVAKHEGTTADKLAPGEFRGMTLLDLAKETLTRANVAFRGMDNLRVAGLALSHRSNYQNIGDFAVLFENVLHKILRAAYAIQPDTWSRWCGVGSASDFRAQNWYRLGALSVLDSLTENGEFTNKVIPDAEKTTYTLGTKGNIIAITRQVIVNDDMGLVARLTEMFGRAGKLTIEKAVYTQLLLNGGLGPTQANSQPLFHSSRSNVGTGSAISMAGLDADGAVMAAQLDVNSQEILDIKPNVLLVPRGLQGTAIAINGAEYDPDTTGKLQKPNIVKGMFSDIVGTARLTGTRRYLFADPSVAPVFLVSFLEGQREPVLETQDGWRTDGVELKARLDFGVDVVDYRGSLTNAGA